MVVETTVAVVQKQINTLWTFGMAVEAKADVVQKLTSVSDEAAEVRANQNCDATYQHEKTPKH